MKSITSKFNLYDHFGYILVGLYQIIIGYILLSLIFKIPFPDIPKLFKLEYTIGLILFSYFVGHIIQSLSNFFENLLSRKITKKIFKKTKSEEDKKNEKNNDLKFIEEKAKKFFELPENIKQKYIFKYCQLYALSDDFSGHVALFNSMYSFYRGFFIASLLSLIIGLVVLFLSFFYSIVSHIKTDLIFWLFILVEIFLLWIFNKRKNRFWDYMGEKTLITFDILSKNKLCK